MKSKIFTIASCLALGGLVLGLTHCGKAVDTANQDSIAQTVSEQDRFTLAEIGEAITASRLGVAQGTVIADSTVILTDDSKIRLYFFVGGKGMMSAVSADGITFATEEGVRISEGDAGHSRVIRLSDGRLRFFIGGLNKGIRSYISSDGLSLTLEAGERISQDAAGMNNTSTLSIVQKSGGGYRGYLSDLSTPDTGPAPRLIKSATASDLFTWAVDSGVRIGAGASALTGSAEQTHALQRGNDGVTLFYFRNNPTGLIYATSTDGLNFSTEYSLQAVGEGNGPNIIRRSDGVYLLYYDSGGSGGNSIRVGKLELM